jgi:hypothetical protein
LRLKFAEESYRVCTLLSTEWRVDLTVASSSDAISEPLVHVKVEVDTSPHLGSIAPSYTVDGKRFQEMAFEMDADKLDVLIHELSLAQSIMESVEH